MLEGGAGFDGVTTAGDGAYMETDLTYYNMQFTKALPAAKKAYELADKEDELLMHITRLIAELEG